MNKYNLYRIRKEAEQSLVDKLESVGMQKIADTECDGYQVSFYLPPHADKVDIWWAETYADLLQGVDTPQNQMYFAALLLSKPSACYAVSLGKTHFYLRPFCDPDFGLDVAERIVDPEDVRIKNSKYHKCQRSKTITTYLKGSAVDYDSGESFHYVRARTVEQKTWGGVASFGSSVQFSLPIGWRELPRLIEEIERELETEPRFTLPRVQRVADERKIAELDARLVREILTAAEVVRVESLSVSGVEFVFSEGCGHSLYLKGERRPRQAAGELTIEALVQFVEDKGIDLYQELNNVRVHVHNEYGRDYSDAVKAFLDYVDDEQNCCLIDGEWYSFNQSYVDYLHAEVDRLDLEYGEDLDVRAGMTEPPFIDEMVAKNGYTKLHTSLESVEGEYRMEVADLYKDGALFCVKFGSVRKVGYAIDQATATVRALQAKGGVVDVGGRDESVEKVCLWLVLDRRTKVERLSDVNSLILHMKLAEWRRLATNAGFRPVVRLGRRR